MITLSFTPNRSKSKDGVVHATPRLTSTWQRTGISMFFIDNLSHDAVVRPAAEAQRWAAELEVYEH
jgi:hypothetical protein